MQLDKDEQHPLFDHLQEEIRELEERIEELEPEKPNPAALVADIITDPLTYVQIKKDHP